MKVGKALARCRKAKQLSQAALAKKLHVSAGTIGGWESGTHGIRIKRLPAIARALGIDISELMA